MLESRKGVVYEKKLILFVLFFTTFCFAEEQAQKVEQMVMEFLENGSYIVIDEEIANRFVNKTGIESLTVFSRYFKNPLCR